VGKVVSQSAASGVGEEKQRPQVAFQNASGVRVSQPEGVPAKGHAVSAGITVEPIYSAVEPGVGVNPGVGGGGVEKRKTERAREAININHLKEKTSEKKNQKCKTALAAGRVRWDVSEGHRTPNEHTQTLINSKHTDQEQSQAPFLRIKKEYIF
jgi:hypothetical protein